MYLKLTASKDTYITNKIVRTRRVTGSNVGQAATIDMFKLYGATYSGSTPNLEYSRGLVQFDIDPLEELVNDGKIDIASPSFSAYIKMYDVFGGQPTPTGFSLVVSPMSKSWDEGRGKDVVFYSDKDSCNFLTASHTVGNWVLSGCASSGPATASVDYITNANLGAGYVNIEVTQSFSNVDDNLYVNVTNVVSATLAGILPDNGYRIAFDSTTAADQYTYFVKRFATRHAYDETKRPEMIVRFDDSIQDDSLNLFFNSSGSLFLYNDGPSGRENIFSASTELTGLNCLKLKLYHSGTGYAVYFTGSQHKWTNTYMTGVYSASFALSSADSTFKTMLTQTGSVDLYPVWTSVDGLDVYHTGSRITVRPRKTSMKNRFPSNKHVTVLGLSDTHGSDETLNLRINVFDPESPTVTLSRVYVESTSMVMRDIHWSLRDAITGRTIVPFDTSGNSTRVSSDANGNYFMFMTKNFQLGRSYVFDVLLKYQEGNVVYKNCSPVFRISDI